MIIARTGRTVLALAIVLTATTSVSAQRLSIGQVDTGRLLIGQRVDLFVSIDTPDDVEPSLDNIAVYESADGSVYREVDAVYDLASVRSLDAPLAFYVLIDNSGSMYEETVPGSDDVRRIDAAREAIRDFANSITNERDRVGLAAFNTGYRELTPPSTDKAGVGELLEAIEEPAREEAYTELYAALVASASDASAVGRRTVIVLSDGENYPYSVYEDEPHPVHGERLFTHEDAIEAFQREGLSLFAIHYGDREDPNLDAIAERTGGAVYRARGEQELARVYREIRGELLDEYRLTYRATMIPAERRFVR
ncbi:MAG: vWA domain-containing protein, partial [bacterium]